MPYVFEGYREPVSSESQILNSRIINLYYNRLPAGSQVIR